MRTTVMMMTNRFQSSREVCKLEDETKALKALSEGHQGGSEQSYVLVSSCLNETEEFLSLLGNIFCAPNAMPPSMPCSLAINLRDTTKS